MTRRTVRSALLVRAQLGPADESERGSLPLLMLVIIMTAAFGAVISTMMLSASHTATNVQARVQAEYAARSGINAVLGQLRAATSSANANVGDSGRLPCGPVTSGSGGASINSGVAPGGNDAGTASYTVSIAYYDVDPSTLSSNNLASYTSGGGQRMLCTSAGPYNSAQMIRTPRYALITSTGSFVNGTQSSTRTVQTTYNFQVLNQNIAGGQIRLYPASPTQAIQWCMDAGANPALGVAVTLQPCSGASPPIAQQVWAYRSDLSIELVSSVTNPNSAGLCLDTAANPTAHNAGDPIVLERCAVADASVCPAGSTPSSYHQANPSSTCSVSPWNQQWSVDDNGHLRDANTSQTDVGTMCINAASQTAGTTVNIQGCAGGTTDPSQAWIPSATTGAGMAGPGNQQLVNFQQFAACLDVTGQNVNTSYLILYTCKQNPNPSLVAFNQRFVPQPALGVAPTQVLLTTSTGGVTYCLRSPQTVGGYPVMVPQGVGVGQCPLSAALAGSGSPFVWTVSQKWANASATTELPYAAKYTIADSSSTPLCLGIGAPNPGTPNYNTAIVTTCSGDNSQKWNAAPYTSGASLTNTSELNTTSGN